MQTIDRPGATAPDQPGEHGFPHVGALHAQRLLDIAALRLAPALVTGLLVWSHVRMETPAVVAFVVSLCMANVVAKPSYPSNLLPIAGPLFRAACPVVGTGAASIVCYMLVGDFLFGSLVSVLPAAWLVLLLGLWINQHFQRERQVRVAVIGSPSLASGLEAELEEIGLSGYEVIGWIEGGDGSHRAEGSGPAARRLGGLKRIREVVCEHRVDLLVRAPANGDNGQRLHVYEKVAAACLDLPVRMIDGVQLYEELLGHVPLGTTDAAWFQYLMHPRYRAGSGATKRLLDLVLGGMAVVVTTPIVLAAALAILLTDGGAPFLYQGRIGEAGREFRMAKLRSMRVDAEADGEAQLATEDDARVTTVGRLLRRTHIDELPQLWNVIRGEMSLVGPRPERGQLVTELEGQFRYYDRRHLVKPGITGWAQVRCGYAGNDIGVAWKLCHDLYYLKHRSVLTDLAILAETIRAGVADSQYGLRAPDERFIVGQATAGT